MNLGMFYLIAAVALLFGAGFFAARRAFPQLQSKHVGLVALIALLTVGLIWVVLNLTGRKRETTPLTPPTQTSPLQPNQDQP
jgi:hypothetical protein